MIAPVAKAGDLAKSRTTLINDQYAGSAGISNHAYDCPGLSRMLFDSFNLLDPLRRVIRRLLHDCGLDLVQ